MNVNGHPPQDPAAQSAQPGAEVTPIPGVIIIYREHPQTGARMIAGLRIGGIEYGGVAGVEIKANPQGPVRLVLETFWPFEWQKVDDAPLAVATRMPPEPPKGPRRFP